MQKKIFWQSLSIFTQIRQLHAPEAFYSWCKKITINHCLLFLRKRIRFDELPAELDFPEPAKHNWYYKDVEHFIDKLPQGCTSVFNLSVIEGYTHKEIFQKAHPSHN